MPSKEIVTTPLSGEGERIYRLYLADMGIFTYQSKENATNFIDGKYRSSLSGVYFENYVATELTYHGYPLFYWQGKNDAELEFLIESKGKVFPIDVKKKKGSLNSLSKYSSHNHLEMAIKVSANQYGFDKESKILTIPFYQLFLLLENFDNFTN